MSLDNINAFVRLPSGRVLNLARVDGMETPQAFPGKVAVGQFGENGTPVRFEWIGGRDAEALREWMKRVPPINGREVEES